MKCFRYKLEMLGKSNFNFMCVCVLAPINWFLASPKLLKVMLVRNILVTCQRVRRGCEEVEQPAKLVDILEIFWEIYEEIFEKYFGHLSAG